MQLNEQCMTRYLNRYQISLYPLALLHCAVDGLDEGLHLSPGQAELLLQRGQRQPASHKHQSLTESSRRAESVWVVVYINPRHSPPLQSGHERFVLNMDTTTLWTVRSCSKVSGSDNVIL